jgi:FkbM family methyltransferase
VVSFSGIEVRNGRSCTSGDWSHAPAEVLAPQPSLSLLSMLEGRPRGELKMSWISYAQNAEDVRLRRAFAGQPTGFYIDVGANNPVDFSITKHFYESGWSGINVEPAPGPFSRIVADRRRDTNLNVGCSNRAGSMTLHVARGRKSGLSTFTAEEAAIHRANGLKVDAIPTRVETLAAICERHVGGRAIDFLSIDVEGHEREVLEGADLTRFRPRVVVVEATRPNTTEPTHDRWEALLLECDYRFAVFDGLNRFYVRIDEAALLPLIALAPNVFDEFVPYKYKHPYKRELDDLRADVLEHPALGPVLRTVDTALGKVRDLVRRHRSP